MVVIQINKHRPPNEPSPNGGSPCEEQRTTVQVPEKKPRIELVLDDEEELQDDLINYSFFSLDCSILETSLLDSEYDDWPKEYDIMLFTNVKNTDFLWHSMFESFTMVVTPQNNGQGRMALLSKIQPEKIECQGEMGGAATSSVIIAEFKSFTFVGVTAPYVGDEFANVEDRISWDKALLEKELNRLKPVVAAGDFKAVRDIIDMGDPDDGDYERILHLPRLSGPERIQFELLLGTRLMDTFREKNKDVIKFTTVPGETYPPFLSYRANYILISARAMPQVVQSDILMDEYLKCHPTVAKIYL